RLCGLLFAPDERGLCVVSVDGRVVSAIEPAAGAPDGSVGGPSYRIVPGLIDIQVNGAFGDDFADPRADLARIRREMPRFGVTAFVPTIVTSPPEAYAPALANLRASSRPGEARVPGVHIEGPYISPRHKGTHDPAQLRLPDRREVESWLEAGDVSWLTLAPELPGALPLIELLADRGVRVSVGHTDATWTEAAAAERAGATMATHLFNAMRPLRHRDPGVVGYVLASGLLAGFMADGRHLAFETIRLLARIKAPDELFLVTDALAGLGMPPGRYALAGREYVSDGVTGHLPDGTLSGSLLPMDRAVRNLVVEAGLPPPVAIALATRNPARALGLEGLGRIAVGGPADLVLLGPDWRVDRTYVAGELAYDAETGAPETDQVGAVR
ncbi:MAG TPA: N-acetylglucosamine-6-phosphate deacetylase, partial [Candidatus Dormibacteraeota bacterium]|nr:N-acetylglucosamine-6-phosphate deacetylase [Candidatus Dormibacteraeota bacterium]